MIILISGATHTGKTVTAQKLLEQYKFPYLSIDHIKMGLIRSGNTELTAYDDEKLTPYLWNIVKEIIKTAIENGQNLIVEGCYIPFDWQSDFTKDYIDKITFFCIVMSENYIKRNFLEILKHENDIEQRLSCTVTENDLIAENNRSLQLCKEYGLNYILIDKNYEGELCARLGKFIKIT